MTKNAYAKKKEDFGEVKSVKVECVSETSWFDNATLGKDIKPAAGGINTNQYDVAYNEENLGGYAAVIEVEALDGKKTKYLMDSGWSNDWMDYVFGPKRCGQDAQKQRNRYHGDFPRSHRSLFRYREYPETPARYQDVLPLNVHEKKF